MFCKHENGEKWWDVALTNVRKNDNSSEYRAEYTFPNAYPGRYTCQIQSTCCFSVSEMSGEIFAYKEEEVTFVFLFSASQKHIQNPVNG